MAPLALLRYRVGNFLDGQVLEGIGFGVECLTADQQSPICPYVLGNLDERLIRQVLRRDEDEVRLGGVSVVPVFIGVLTRRVGETHMLAHGLSQHLRLVILAYDPVAVFVLLQERRGKAEVSEAPSAFPIYSLRHSIGISTIYNFVEARKAMRFSLLSKFNTYPSSLHFVRSGSGSA